MLRRLTKRRWLLVLLALALPLGVFAFSKWWEGTRNVCEECDQLDRGQVNRLYGTRDEGPESDGA